MGTGKLFDMYGYWEQGEYAHLRELVKDALIYLGWGSNLQIREGAAVAIVLATDVGWELFTRSGWKYRAVLVVCPWKIKDRLKRVIKESGLRVEYLENATHMGTDALRAYLQAKLLGL